jgi:hypothetical protein
MSEQDVYSTFMQANDAFRKGNSLADDYPAARKHYDQAILGYEKIITEAGVSNSMLFYNLANAYMLKGDIGRAILNYRNAEKLDRSDTDIQKNLAFARSQRLDKVDVAAKKKVLDRLFFWHYGLPARSKFIAACICFAFVCLTLTIRIWFPMVPGTVPVCVITTIITICFAVSVGVDRHVEVNNRCGVIVAESVQARQGDGAGYPLSFKEPLHAGTEFDVIEQRPGWWHVRLTNGEDAWIADSAVQQIIL